MTDTFQYTVNGCVEYELEITTRRSHSVDATLYQCTAWDDGSENVLEREEVSRWFLKWDGCAHVGLQNPEMVWAHICGKKKFEQLLEVLRWTWDTLAKEIPAYNKREAEA